MNTERWLCHETGEPIGMRCEMTPLRHVHWPLTPTAETPGGGGLTEAEPCCEHGPGDHSQNGTCRFWCHKATNANALTAAERRLLADRVLGGAEPSMLMVRAVESIVADRVAAAAVQARAEVVARVEALAAEIESPLFRAGIQRRRLWADRLRRAALAGPNPRGGQDGGGE